MNTAGMQRIDGGRIEGLDLIRGLAIALVMVRHAWPEAVGSGGIVGVVAFFALSGYLITGLLMNDLRRSGRVRYGRFLRNRAVRLFPPLLAMLAALAAAMILRNPHGDQGPVWRAVVTGITYTGNLPFDHGTTAIGHLWTLATEEQFYLVWPLLLTLAFRRKRMGPMVAASAVVVLLALLLTMRAAVPDISTIYPLPTSWALALIIGAAARLWEPRLRTLLPTAARTRTVLGVAIAITLVALSFVPEDKGAAWPYLVMGPVVAVLASGLIFIWGRWRRLPSRALKPLHALGTISYAAYLWNYPIVTSIGERPLPWFAALGSIALTLAAATVSWWLLERPLRRWRTRLDARPPYITPPPLSPHPSAPPPWRTLDS